MFFSRDIIPNTAPPTQWQSGPTIVGPTPADLRMKALDSVAHLRESGLTTDQMLAEAQKVYDWLLGESLN